MIDIYGSDACGHCGATKDYMKQKKIDYKFIDIGADGFDIDGFLKLSGGQVAVPLICNPDRNNACVIGFDKSKIDKLIDG